MDAQVRGGVGAPALLGAEGALEVDPSVLSALALCKIDHHGIHMNHARNPTTIMNPRVSSIMDGEAAVEDEVEGVGAVLGEGIDGSLEDGGGVPVAAGTEALGAVMGMEDIRVHGASSFSILASILAIVAY